MKALLSGLLAVCIASTLATVAWTQPGPILIPHRNPVRQTGPACVESADLTTITAPDVSTAITGPPPTCVQWQLANPAGSTNPLYVDRNNVPLTGNSANVQLLVWHNHTAYQMNCSTTTNSGPCASANFGNWWYWDGVAPWVATINPFGIAAALTATDDGNATTYTLAWTCTNSTSATGSWTGSTLGASGTASVSPPPGVTTYTVKCFGAHGVWQVASATATETGGGGPCPPLGLPYTSTFPPAKATQTLCATTFLASWGMHTHDDTTDDTNQGTWLNSWKAAGFRVARVNWDIGSGVTFNQVSAFFADGERVSVTGDGPFVHFGGLSGNPTGAAQAWHDDIVNHNLQNKIWSLQPVNEGNTNFGCWPGCVAAFANAVHTIFKGDSRTSGILISAPNINGPNNTGEFNNLRNAGCCSWADLGDTHSDGGDLSNGGGNIIGADLWFKEVNSNVQILVGSGKPYINSENSWPNPPACVPNTTDEGTSALEFTRHYFDIFRWNVMANMSFVLRNDVNCFGYGILTGGTSSGGKVQYNAIQSFTTLLADSSTPTSVIDLNYSWSGTSDPNQQYCKINSRGVQVQDNSNPTCSRTLVFEKSNGEYWIALWEQMELYDDGTKTIVNPRPPTADVTISFPGTHTLTAYRPIDQNGNYHGTTAICTTTGTTIRSGNCAGFHSEAGVTLIKVQ